MHELIELIQDYITDKEGGKDDNRTDNQAQR